MPTVATNVSSAAYSFTAYAATITSITATCTAGGTATFAGTDLPTKKNEYDTVFVCGKPCTVASASATAMTCKIGQNLQAGNWLTKVLTTTGETNYQSGLSRNLEVTPTVASMTKADGSALTFNTLGGQTIKVTGTNFPKVYPMRVALGAGGGQSSNLDPALTTPAELVYTAKFNIYDSGTAYELCTSYDFSASQTTFQCVTKAVTAPSSPSSSTELKLCVSTTWGGSASEVCSAALTGVTFSTGTNQPASSPKSGVSYSVSPAYKQSLEFTLTNQGQLGASDGSSINAVLKPTSGSTYEIKVNVKATDSGTNTAKLFFPGAPGNFEYTLEMTDSSYGVIDTTTSAITITAKADFQWKSGQPTSGSVSGGTEIIFQGNYVAYSATSTFTSSMIQLTVGGEQGVFADVLSITDQGSGAFEINAITRPAVFNQITGKRDDQTLNVFGLAKVINEIACATG